MANALRDRFRQDELANYEQQSPNRQVNYRQVSYPQDYMQQSYTQDVYNSYPYAQGYTAPRQESQPYMGSYSNQATQFVDNGFVVPQNNINYVNYTATHEQTFGNTQFATTYTPMVRAAARPSGKKTINKDMIKVIVTIMVVALVICSLLIANQFMSNNQAQAEENVQSIDSELLASVVTEDGSSVASNVTLIPEYEYETSTNWFDKLCDSLGLKLK